MGYLDRKPGSLEEVIAEKTKLESGFQDKFKNELEKAGKGVGSMTPKEKSEFFNKVDDIKKTKTEEVQKEDATAGYSASGASLAASKKHKNFKEIWGARKASGGYHGDKKFKKLKNQHDPKDKDKDVEEGMETMVPSREDDGKKLKSKKVADTGKKATPVDTDPKIKYST